MPEDTKSVNLQVRCHPELVRGLDDLRRAEADLPTRAEMARRLIERAIASKAAASKPKSTKR